MPKSEKLLAALLKKRGIPATYQPEGDTPREVAGFATPLEWRILKHITGSKAPMTEHGVRSYVAPPSRSQKEANERTMAASKSYGGINTSTVSTQDRGSTNSYGSNAAQRQADERSNYRSPPSVVARQPGGGQGGSQDAVMRHLEMGKPLIRPMSEPDPRFNVGVIDAPRLLADPTNGIGRIRAQPAQIPVPRQNPLSNTDLFRYQQGRPRDYVFEGMDQEAISRAVRAQELFGAPVTATSGMRNPLLNRKVGGAKGSQHMQGRAIDLSIPDTTGDETARLITAMKEAGFTGIGGYRPGKVHGDIGPVRMWGPDTHEGSISQLPQNMQIAMAGGPAPPKATVARALAPVVNRGLVALKNVFAQNDIPIPRQKPMVPSTVAPANGPPIPQMRPRIPSTVASATSVPRPQPKPSQPVITPAGGMETAQSWLAQGRDIAGTALQSAGAALRPVEKLIAQYGPKRTASFIKQAAQRQKGGKKTKSQFAREYAALLRGERGGNKKEMLRRKILLGEQEYNYA